MRCKNRLLPPVLLLMFIGTLFISGDVFSQPQAQKVRLAKLIIDTNQLQVYKAALTEEIKTSLKLEKGVLTLYAFAEKDHPTHISILEIYADEDSYKAHLQTPHFIKYKTTTKDMVKSLELVETVPLLPENSLPKGNNF